MTSFAYPELTLVNTGMELYEAGVSPTRDQIHTMIDELVTYFGYEDITERVMAERQKVVAEYASEGYQDQKTLCVLYKETVGPFYCHSPQQLVLKLMEEYALRGLLPSANPNLNEVWFVGSVQNYDQLKTRVFQGKTYIPVVKR